MGNAIQKNNKNLQNLIKIALTYILTVAIRLGFLQVKGIKQAYKIFHIIFRIMMSYWKKTLVCLFLSIKLGLGATNLFQNGNFDQYTVGDHYEATSWHAENGTHFTVVNYSIYTNGLSLLDTQNVSICQRIQNLIIEAKYYVGLKVKYRRLPFIPDILELHFAANGVYQLVEGYQNSPADFITRSYGGTMQHQVPYVTFCVMLRAKFTSSYDPSNVFLTVDDFNTYIQPRSSTASTYEISLTSADKLKALITTDYKLNYSWNLTKFAQLTKLMRNNTQLSATFVVTSTQPLRLNVSSTTPLSVDPSLQLKLPSYSFKDTLGQWVYYNLQRNVTVPFSCWMRQHETIDTVEISTDLAYDRQIVADFSSGLLRMSMNSRHVPAERIDYQECGGKLCMLVLVDQFYLSDKLLRLDIPDAAVHDSLGNGCFFLITIYDLTPQLVYFSPTEKLFSEALITSVLAIVRIASTGLNAWSLLGFSYLIHSLVGFFHLAILSVLAPVSSLLWPFRYVLNQLFQMMRGDGFESLFLSDVAHLYKGTDFLNFVPERLDKEREGYCWIGEFNFMENFLANIWDDLLSLIAFLVKLGVIKILSFLPIQILKKICRKVLAMKGRLFLFQVIAVNPTILVTMGDILSNFSLLGSSTYLQKINFWLTTTVPFFSIIPIFTLTLVELNRKSIRPADQRRKNKSLIKSQQFLPSKSFSCNQILGPKRSGKRKNNIMLQTKPIKGQFVPQQLAKAFRATLAVRRLSAQLFQPSQLVQIIFFIDNFMFFLISFTSALFSLWLFLVFQTVIVSLRLIIVFQLRSFFTRFHLFKQISNKVIWFLYNGCYLVLAISGFKSQFVQKYCSMGIILLIVLGLGSEILFAVIDGLLAIFAFIKKQSKTSKSLQVCTQTKNVGKVKKQIHCKFSSNINTDEKQEKNQKLKQTLKLKNIRAQFSLIHNKFSEPAPMDFVKAITKQQMKTKKVKRKAYDTCRQQPSDVSEMIKSVKTRKESKTNILAGYEHS